MNRRWLALPALMLTGTMSASAQSDSLPVQHVNAARTLLAQVSDSSLKKAGKIRVEELRKLFDDMAKAYPGSADWRTKFSAVESQLTRIIGGGRGPGLEAATAGAGTGNIAAGSTAASGTASATQSGAAAGTVGGNPTTESSGAQRAGTAATGSGTQPAGTTPATGAQTGVAQAGGAAVGVAGSAGSATSGGANVAAGGTSSTSSATGATQSGSMVGAGSGIAVVGEIGMKDIDPAMREQLRQFRLELELFFTAATSTEGSPPTVKSQGR